MRHFSFTLLPNRLDGKLAILALLLLLTPLAYSQQILWPANINADSPSTVNTIFQRDNSNKATIRFVVSANSTINSCQVRFKKYDLNGGIATGYIDPRPSSNNLSNGYLNGVSFTLMSSNCQAYLQFDVAGGMYQMEALINGATATRDFGVGEVFAIAGQSNAAGYAKDGNPEASTTYTKFVHFSNNKTMFDGDDPGSAGVGRKYFKYYWGKLGSQLAGSLNVPIAFYQAAWSGTSVLNWKLSSQGQTAYGPYGGAYPAGYPYNNLKDILQSTKNQVGLRAVLWHQGERYDGGNYNDDLDALIQMSRQDAGNEVAWVIARASYVNGNPNSAIVNSQNRVIGHVTRQLNDSDAKNYGDPYQTPYGRNNVFTGPATDYISGSNNRLDNTHFNQQGQNEAANAWQNALTSVYSGNGQNFFQNSTPILNGQSVNVATPSCGGSCSPPYLTANPASVNPYNSSTLTGTGCSGTVYWSTGQQGSSIVVNPGTTTTYISYCIDNTGCRSNNTAITVSVPETPPSNPNPPASGAICSNMGDQCSGNSSEQRTYTISATASSQQPVYVTYRSHEGAGKINININGQQVQVDVDQTGVDEYRSKFMGNFNVNASNNVVLSSGQGYVCFRQICIGGNSGTPPTNPNPPTTSNNCSASEDKCSGNSFEQATYTSSANAGYQPVYVTYRSHEGPGKINISIGNQQAQVDVDQTSVTEYKSKFLGNFNVSASNTIVLSSGQAYVCFRQVCIGSPSGRIAVSTGDVDATTSVSVFPNPAIDKVRVRYYQKVDGSTKLRLLSSSGRLILERQYAGKAGLNDVDLSLEESAAGTKLILIELQVDNHRVVNKIIRQ